MPWKTDVANFLNIKEKLSEVIGKIGEIDASKFIGLIRTVEIVLASPHPSRPHAPLSHMHTGPLVFVATLCKPTQPMAKSAILMYLSVSGRRCGVWQGVDAHVMP